ncbi:MAG: FAD-dependent oxidoreductase [Gammaproteobacteria bacterium]|nr:FAD-dependent oxidoreductase [Gammaproteobacteria bacterium]
MHRHSDIVIVGGGIIGLLSARELHQAGLSVTVIDKGLIGQESSWAGGGILLPLYPWRQDEAISTLVLHSLGLYPSLSHQLTADSGINPQWNPCGLLITRNPDIDDALNWCNRYRIAYEFAENRLSGLHTEAINPLFLPGIAQIRNPRLIRSLKQDLSNKGVNLVENCQLAAVHCMKHRLQSIDTSQGRFHFHHLIISAGAWTSGLLAEFFSDNIAQQPQIVPVKGQMLLFAAEPDTLSTIVLDGGNYLIPRLDGHILAGSTVEGNTFDKSPTAAAREQISEFALSLFPALNNYPLIKQWAGIRPGSPSGIPYIDRHPDIDNLFINAGHFRNGLAMAPASAQLMADLILNRPPCVNPEPYSLIRVRQSN